MNEWNSMNADKPDGTEADLVRCSKCGASFLGVVQAHSCEAVVAAGKASMEYADKVIEKDMVHHPKHYKQGGIEVIDVLEAWSYLDFRLLNAVKYIARSPFKGNAKQDLEKAIWYINRYIEKGITK